MQFLATGPGCWMQRGEARSMERDDGGERECGGGSSGGELWSSVAESALHILAPAHLVSDQSPTLGAHTHAHGLWVGMGYDRGEPALSYK